MPAKKKQPPSSKSELNSQAVELEHLANQALPTLWVDSVRLAARSDSLATLSFYTIVPPQTSDAPTHTQASEVARLQVSADHAKRIADVICKSLDYYPEKPSATKKSTKRKVARKKKTS